MSRPGFLPPGATTPNPGVVSPYFNPPNNAWDNGEGFPAGTFAPDHGGYHDDDHANLSIADVHSYFNHPSGPYWQGYDPYSPGSGQQLVRRFVGYLRPASLGRYQPDPNSSIAQVQDAAFEIFAPMVRDPSKQLVVVIGVWATSGTPPRASQTGSSLPFEFDYPGHRMPEGLVVDVNPNSNQITSIRRPADGAWPVLNPPAGHQIVWAYIVPRTFPRSLTFAMQRAIQLAKAIDLILAQPSGSPFLPPGFTPLVSSVNATPKIITGGSFGGLTAQIGVLAHPEVFHGAVPLAFSASMRRVPGEQATFNQIGRALGMYGPESSKGPWDVLNWCSYLRSIGWDYFNSSTTMRYRRGDLVRPMAFLFADEDTVTCGVDNLPLLTGVRGYVERNVLNGPPLMAWSVVDKRCHGEAGPYLTPIGGLPETNPEHYVTELAPAAVLSWQNNPNPAPLPIRTDDASEDPYAHFFDRGVFAAPPANPYLVLDPNFRNPASNRPPLGHGTAFGWDESLRVQAINGAGAPSIFVLSAEGVVTRFEIETVAATASYPSYQTVTAQVSSVALGAGAHALAVGEVDAQSTGDEVVVGTQRWIHLLRASDLGVIRSRQLDFEHEQPRRLQIAQVVPGGSAKQVLFTTLYGHLMVLDAQLATLTDFGEPGIQDFVVHEGLSYPTAGTNSKTPITILSFRQHLVNITLNVPGGPVPCPAEAHCWSEAQYGGPGDLELVGSGAGSRVVASFNCSGGSGNVVRVFDAATLQPSVPGGFTHQALETKSAINDLVVVHDSGGNLAGYMLCVGDGVWWFPANGGQAINLALTQFGPFANICAIAAADLIASPNYREELIVSTMAGHIVFFTVQEMLSVAPFIPPLKWDRPGENGLTATAKPPRTNHALAATWGLISRWYTPDGDILLPQLIAANQAGGLFEVDPSTGQTSFVLDLRVLLERPYLVPYQGFPGYDSRSYTRAASPIRNLGVIAENSLSVPTVFVPQALTPERYRLPASVAPPGVRQLWWYRSLPNQNAKPVPLDPLFYKDKIAEELAQPPHLPVCTGVAAFMDGGAVQAFPPNTPGGLVREIQWWGGESLSDQNLIQGAYATPTTIVNSWYTAKHITGSLTSPPPYGRTSSEGKDLRNLVRGMTTYNLQSLRLGRDGTGTVIVAGTPGGGVTLIRPANAQSPAADVDYGTILWSSSDPSPMLDDGHGCMALAVRQVPGSPNDIDIFYGACLAYPDPQALFPTQSGMPIVGSVRWLRWQNGAMVAMGPPLFLDPALSGLRGGFGVSGMAVGNVIDAVPGAELVVTTLAGDLFVFQLGTASIQGAPLVHTWISGALGAFNGIVIENMDFDTKNELYVSSPFGVWKWRQL